MYLLMAEKANNLLQKHQVREFPVSLDVITHIIRSEGISIQITKYLSRALFYDNTIYIAKGLENIHMREYMVHEAGHMYHAGNTALLPPLVVDKNEGQAKAFAAYFLMPVGIFEEHLFQGESDHSLAEIFGVKFELVEFRKVLYRSLLESGNYERLACCLNC